MQYRIHDAATLTAMRPLIRAIVADLNSAFGDVLKAAGTGDGCIDRELEVVQLYVTELEALGGTVRSLDPIAIEFVAEEQGVIGYLPWCAHGGRMLAFRSAHDLCMPNAAAAQPEAVAV